MCNLAAHHRTSQIAHVPPAGQHNTPRDHRCESEIGAQPDGHGLLPFTLQIKVCLTTPAQFTDRLTVYHTAAGGSWQNGRTETTTYNCTVADPPVLQTIFSAFQDSINTHWNDKLWLGTRSPNVQGLTCGVELTKVDTPAEANLNITVLYRCTPPANAHPETRRFRAFCLRGGMPDTLTQDMVIAYPASQVPGAPENGNESDFSGTHQRRTSDQGIVPITQNVAAHEFGHYLGLRHTCASQAPSDTNTSNAYCARLMQARQEDIMAAGNTIRRPHGDLWRRRLERHHYHCERQFRVRAFAAGAPP